VAAVGRQNCLPLNLFTISFAFGFLGSKRKDLLPKALAPHSECP